MVREEYGAPAVAGAKGVLEQVRRAAQADDRSVSAWIQIS